MKVSARAAAGWLVALATAVLVWRALLVERQTVDDLFITLRYARNLAERHEIAFSAGEHVEGASSPAWTAILALAWKLGARGVASAKMISLVAAALVPTVCAIAVARARESASIWIAALPAVAIAVDADVATWASSGMDTPLFALACVTCVALVAFELDRTAAFALGALVWVRPEGPLFTLLGVVALVLRVPRDRAVRLVILALVPIVMLVGARLAYFHDLLPNTFYAKIRAVDGRDFTGLGYAWNALRRRPSLLAALPIASLAFGGPSRTRAVAASMLVACFLFVVAAGGDWMPNRRLLVPAIPLAAVAGSLLFDRAPSPRLAWIAMAVVAIEGALTFEHALDQTWRAVEREDRRIAPGWPPRGVLRGPYPLDWMPTHLLHTIAPYVHPGDLVAHVDVGELPYVMGDVSFLDGLGLVDRAAARAVFSPKDEARRVAAREEIFARDPAVIITVLDGKNGRAISPAQAAAMDDARFSARWKEIDRVGTWGGNTCVTFARVDRSRATDEEANRRVQTWLASTPDIAPAP
jgi:hypothetical protein